MLGVMLVSFAVHDKTNPYKEPILDRLTTAFRNVATSPDMLRRLRAIDTAPGYEDPPTFRRSVIRTLRQWEELAASLDLYATG